jgi:hypothetical protein
MERATMKFSILHPSRRPEKWLHSFKEWRDRADSYQEHILAVDTDQLPEFCSVIQKARIPVILAVSPGKDSTTAYNVAAKASSGDALIISADDVFPPLHWDTLLEQAIPKDRNEWVLHCSTGHPRNDDITIFQPIFSRAVYERWGYVAWPEYRAMYADNDWTEKAYAEGLVISAKHILLEHRHPTFRREWALAWDEVYEHEASQEHYKIGSKIFAERRASGFKL